MKAIITALVLSILGTAVALFAPTVGLAEPGVHLAERGDGPPHRGPRGPRGHKGPEARELELVEALDLDEATRARVRAIIDETRDQGAALQQDKRRARRALRELLEQDSPDEAQVLARIDALGRLETDARKLRIRTMLRIRALLTPAQRAKMASLHRDRGPKLGAACQPDVQTLCPRAEGPRDAFRCILQHQDRVSPACKEALLTSKHAKEGRGPHRRPAFQAP